VEIKKMEEKEITAKDLRALKKHLQENIKEFKRIGENYYNDDYIKARCNLEVVEKELTRQIAIEKELKRTFKEAKKEKVLQQIPGLTQRLSYELAKSNFSNQEQQAIDFMKSNNNVTDTYTLSNGTGMHLRSAGRCLSVLNKKCVIRPCSTKVSEYGRRVTVYELVNEKGE
jgi:hypothetical protein